MLFDAVGDEYHFSKKYDLHIVDRVGGGDSFGGGLIYALLAGKGNQRDCGICRGGLRAQAYRRGRL